MAKYTFEVKFVATFRRLIEADTAEEAQALLDDASIETVYQDHEWTIDPFEFQKQISDSWKNDDDTDTASTSEVA